MLQVCGGSERAVSQCPIDKFSLQHHQLPINRNLIVIALENFHSITNRGVSAEKGFHQDDLSELGLPRCGVRTG